MKVSEKDVNYVADLANLELTAEERTRMVRDLNSILGHIDLLNELDTSNVRPMAQVADRHGAGESKDKSKNGSDRYSYAMREDVREGLRKSLAQDVALANAPDSDGTFFEVPKVIEK